jgi:hypothetical protein
MGIQKKFKAGGFCQVIVVTCPQPIPKAKCWNLSPLLLGVDIVPMGDKPSDSCIELIYPLPLLL